MSEVALSAYIARTLNELGVERAFVYPGDPIIDLLESLRATGIDVVLSSREATAAVMAEATGMLTGLPGVCISTLGPGSTAMIGGVASANLDRSPVLAISGQIDRGREQYFTHQVADHARLYAPITKWTAHFEPASAATILRKAIRVALAERPGAVHLTMHEDVACELVSDTGPALPPVGRARSVGVGTSILGGSSADASAMLASARRPIALAGPSVSRLGANSNLASFVESFGMPVVVSPMAKGAIPEDHECFAGVLDMACAPVVWSFLAQADLLVLVGFDGAELIKPWTLRTPCIHVDAVPNTDQIYAASIELVGDVGGSLDWLASKATAARWSAAEIASQRNALRNAFVDGRVEGHLNPSDVVEIVRASANDDSICTADVGSHKLLVGQGWMARRPRTVLMSNGLSAMGFAIPAAVAGAMATGEVTYCFVGDGGFAMTQSELALAADRNLPLVVVVLCDESLNRIEIKQHLRSIASTATRLPRVNVAQVANGLGCEAERVDSPSALEHCLSSKSSSSPLVIEARIDPSQYLEQF